MARLEDLGVPAGLGDVGVPRQRVVALPLGDDVAAAPRGSRAPRRTASGAHAGASGRRPPARPRAGPRTRSSERSISSAVRTARGSTDGHPIHPPYTATMCDTLCAPGPRGMVFAKNSDRPPGEVQIAWPFGRRASAGCTLRTQYLTIGDTGAHAAFLSCPTWLWGAEHGVNEYGVAIGNERVSTTHDAAVGQAGPDRHGPGPPRARARPHRGRGGRRAHRAPRDSRAGWHRRRRPPGGLRLLLPHRRSVRGLRARDGRPGLRGRPLLCRRGHLQPDHCSRHFDRFRDPVAGHGLRRRPPGGEPPFPRVDRFRRADAGRHRRPPARSRDGPLGCSRHRRPCPPAADRGGRGRQRRQRVHARPRARRDHCVHDRRAVAPPRRRCAAARLRGGGKPLRQHLRARLSAHGRRPTPLRPPSSSPGRSCGTPPPPCASWSRPTPTRCRRSGRRSGRSRTSCGPRPTTCSSNPSRWAEVGESWGGRALGALRSCIPSSS